MIFVSVHILSCRASTRRPGRDSGIQCECMEKGNKRLKLEETINGENFKGRC